MNISKQAIFGTRKHFWITLVIFLLSIWLISSVGSQSVVLVSDAAVVSTESTGSSSNPALVMDSQNNIHVVWNDDTDYAGSGTDTDIFYKFWNATTKIWSTTEVISTESTQISATPTLAIDNNDNLHVVWWDSTDFGGSGTDADIFYKFRDATTGNWGLTEVVSTESSSSSTYPQIAIDAQNNIHVAWQDTTDYSGSGTDSDIFYKIWNATSMTWGTTEVISTESTSGSQSTDLEVDSQLNVHVVWWDSTNYQGTGTDADIFYKLWNVTTKNWSTTEVISTESTSVSYRPDIAIDHQDIAHIAWSDATNYLTSGSDYDVFYKYWNTTAGNWSLTEVVSTESTGDSYTPKLGFDEFDNMHLIWDDLTDLLSSGADRDIFYKFHSVVSGNWSTTELVSTESSGSSYAPRLIIGPQNKVHAVWYDNTDLSSAGTDTDIFYKFVFNLDVLDQTNTNTEPLTIVDTTTVTQIQTSTIITIEPTVNVTVTQTTTKEVKDPNETITQTVSGKLPTPFIAAVLSVLIVATIRKWTIKKC